MWKAWGDVVRSERGEEAREDGLIADRSYGEDFEAEDRSCEWSAEDGAEASADANHEEDLTVRVGEGEAGNAVEEDGDLIGQGGSGLESGAFAAGGASEEMSDAGA